MNGNYWVAGIFVLLFSLFSTLYKFGSINFATKKKDQFELFYKIVPHWFEWLGWLTILSVFQYAYQKSNDRILFWVYWGTLLLIFIYFKYIFAMFEFKTEFFKNHKKLKRFLESLLAAYCSITAFQLSIHIAKIIKIVINS